MPQVAKTVTRGQERDHIKLQPSRLHGRDCPGLWEPCVLLCGTQLHDSVLVLEFRSHLGLVFPGYFLTFPIWECMPLIS